MYCFHSASVVAGVRVCDHSNHRRGAFEHFDQVFSLSVRLGNLWTDMVAMIASLRCSVLNQNVCR